MIEEARASGMDPAPAPAAQAARAMAILLAICVAAFCCLHVLYLQRAMPDVPYMDTLRVLALLAGWEQGRVSLPELWGLGSAHQGLINQFLIYANVELLHYNALWANRLTTLAIALVALLIGLDVVADYRKTAGPTIRAGWRFAWVIFLVLIPVQLFSGAGYELFTLDLGLSLWIKNGLIVLYYVLHSRYVGLVGAGRGGSWLGLALSLMGPILVLMVTMGWGGAFVLGATLQVLAGAGFWRRRADDGRGMVRPVLLLWLSLAVYVAVSLLGRGRSDGRPAAHGGRLPRLLGASSWSGQRMAPVARLDPNGGPCAVDPRPVQHCADGMEAYLPARHGPACTACLCRSDGACVGRAGDGLDGVIASRYYMDLILFPIGLVWLLLVLAGPGAGRGAAVTMVGALVLMLGLQVQVYRDEWRTAPYRAELFQSMKQALLMGVPDPEAAALLQAPFKYARAASALMQKEGLGPFHGLAPQRCEAAAVRFLRGWFAEEAAHLSDRSRDDLRRREVPTALGIHYRQLLSGSSVLPDGHVNRKNGVASNRWSP
ncbi:MAG: hypothetical protein WBI41_02835 [Azovibrio sp.]|uniref:hypothetical protein n=1 Tax=Azovibrio sp. TaxID=1872673 RepID=UPI003C76DD33